MKTDDNKLIMMMLNIYLVVYPSSFITNLVVLVGNMDFFLLLLIVFPQDIIDCLFFRKMDVIM